MNPLLDIMSPRARKYVYAAMSLAGLLFFAWQAADGDWKTAATSLVGSAITALAHANTNPVDPQAIQTPAPAQPAPPQADPQP